MRSRFAEVMPELLGTRDDIVLLIADLSAKILDKAARQFPDRVINVGIREQLMIDLAGGLALGGFRPVIHSFAPFLVERPFEQIKISLNHQSVGAVLVSAGASFDISGGGRTHQSPGDVALLNTLPDWTIWVPGHPDEAETALHRAVSSTGLHYIRLSNQSNSIAHANSDTVHCLRFGDDVTVIAVGPILDSVTTAIETIDATLLYTMRPRPFSSERLQQCIAHTNGRVVLIEPMLQGSSTAELRRKIGNHPVSILEIGVPRTELRAYGTPEQHAAAYGLDPTSIRERIVEFLKKE